MLGREEEGFCYSRYDNPTNTALEELVTALEGGHGALACSSGMAAMHIAVLAALMDRRKSVLAAKRIIRRYHQLADQGAGAAGRSRSISWMSATWTRCEQKIAEPQARLRADGDHFKSAAARGAWIESRK